MTMIVLAHMGGIDEALVFLAPIAAFAVGGYYLVYKPLKENDEAAAPDYESEYESDRSE
jgi:hypothetical protein